MFLPDILFCNRKKIINLLSMIVADVLTEYKVKLKEDNSRDTDLSAEVGNKIGKIAAKYRKDKSYSIEKEGIIQSPTSALFVDLHEILDEKKQIQYLKGFDQSILDQITTGEFLELIGKVHQSPLEAAFASIFDLIEQYYDLFADQISRSDLTMLSSLLGKDKATLIITPFADVDTKFITKINILEENEITNRYEIEGDLTIFGRYHKFYDKSESIDLFDFLPGKLKVLKDSPNNPFLKLPKALRDLQNHGFSVGDIPDIDHDSMILKGPVIELNTIAIYIN